MNQDLEFPVNDTEVERYTACLLAVGENGEVIVEKGRKGRVL